jgi:hypothetical protein
MPFQKACMNKNGALAPFLRDNKVDVCVDLEDIAVVDQRKVTIGQLCNNGVRIRLNQIVKGLSAAVSEVDCAGHLLGQDLTEVGQFSRVARRAAQKARCQAATTHV